MAQLVARPRVCWLAGYPLLLFTVCAISIEFMESQRGGKLMTEDGHMSIEGWHSVPEWTIEKCSPDDKVGVYDLLTRAFFKYEPLTCDLTDHPPMDDLFAIKMLGQGHSYKAVLPSGKIVGVVINVHFEDVPVNEEVPSGRILQVVKFFEFLEKEAKLDENGLLELFILAVDPDFRRQGMAKDLGRVSVKYAQLSGYRGIKISCTSQYSADAATALGFKLVHMMPYADYKDDKGNQMFTPAHPHTHARIFVKEFNDIVTK